MDLKRNIFYNVISQILSIIIPLVTAPYISRVIGSEGIGIYSYTTSVANYFAIFILLGVANYGARTLAAYRDITEECSRIFWSIFPFQASCGLIVILIYICYVLFFSGDYTMAFFLQFFYIISVMLDNSWYFTGTEQFKIAVTRGMIVRCLEVAAIFIFVHSLSDLYWYIGIMTIGTLAGKLWLWYFVLKQTGFTKPSWKDIKTHIKPILILFIPVLAMSVFTLMDKVMLEAINHDISAVGIYEYSEKIVKLPLGVITAIGAVMLPRISNLVTKNEPGTSQKYFTLTMKYLGLLVVAMSFGIAGIAPVFSVVFYGMEFERCGEIIPLLSMILITGSWSNIIRTQYLIPNAKDSVYTAAVVMGAGANLILNILFIPKYGAIGAAIGTVGAEVVLFFVHTIGVWRRLPMKTYLIWWLEYTIMGAVMFVFVRVIGHVLSLSVITLLVQIIAGVVSFTFMSILLLIVKKDDIFTRLC